MFVDYEKAFDSLHRDGLCNILGAYGVPTIIQKLSTLQNSSTINSVAQ